MCVYIYIYTHVPGLEVFWRLVSAECVLQWFQHTRTEPVYYTRYSVHSHTHTYTYTHTHIFNTYIYLYISIYICIQMYAYSYICIHV